MPEDIPEKRCELCWHYCMIDSAYGHYHRFPPCIHCVVEKIRRGLRRYVFWEDRYPIVPFCNIACAEYKPGRPTTYQEAQELEKEKQ